MPQKNISIRDIAQQAGVSIATVSRVINNNGRFSEETRQRVQRFIDESGYVTNMAARSLRSSRSRTIGVIVPDISNEWFSRMELELEGSFFEKGYSVFICNTSQDEAREDEYFRLLDAKLVDGIICISGRPEIPTDAISRAIPIVCIDRHPETDAPIYFVESDHRQGGYLATSALIERGCSHIALVSRHRELSPTQSRFKGYRQALADHGLPYDERLRIVVGGDPARDGMRTREAVDALIESGIPLDGIFATNDRRAFQAVSSLQAHGLRVPEDVKVIGFDDTSIASACKPTISTMRQDASALARAARNLFLRASTGESIPGDERHVVLPVLFVERESTG